MASPELRFYDNHRPSPITLPPVRLPPAVDHVLKAEQLAEHSIIRKGIDAWQAVGRGNSFENWKAIGAALAIGKAYALRVTGANRPRGSAYCRTFSAWAKEHHLDTVPAIRRTEAIVIHENLAAIEQWRASLPEKKRLRLIGPQQIYRWRAETAPKAKLDALAKAEKARQHFKACIEALPSEQANLLRQAVVSELCR
jgi:hypothetical protein